jgi:peptidoglycan/LPS O-acetylase OafA/YrhL
MGLLISRIFKPIKIAGAFWICTLILIALFSIPYLNENNGIHINGIYETVCVTFVFPALLWIGASGKTTDKHSSIICKFLGDISYPVYMIHYPIMYLFYAWLIDNKLYTLGATWHVVIPMYLGIVLLAHLCLKLYDEPLRKYLMKKFFKK